MSNEEIFEKLKDIVKRLCPGITVDGVTGDTLLAEQLAMDSLTLLLLALQCEKDFGIRFENLNTAQFKSVGDVCSYIGGKLG